jgi:ribosomal protein S27AE
MSGDYHPELYGQVEGAWRTAPPPQKIIDEAMKAECPDCNINVFIEEHPDEDGRYIIKRAHDETCPWLAQHEKEQTDEASS